MACGHTSSGIERNRRCFRKEEELERKVKEIEIVANDRKDGPAVFTESEVEPAHEIEELKNEADIRTPSKSFLLDANDGTGDESGTEEEQAAFMKELETFHRERCLDFKPPKFYQEPLNCLKLWRAVIRLGGYEQVTSLKLWRQVGESFRPPKTCTTVSWTFRGFYEKALLEYEKYKMRSGELPFTDASISDPASGNQVDLIHASGSGRARRDACHACHAGMHSQRLLRVTDKNQMTTPKREKQLRNIGFLKRKGSSPEFYVSGSHEHQREYLLPLNSIVINGAPWHKAQAQCHFQKMVLCFVMAVAVALALGFCHGFVTCCLVARLLQALEIMVVDVGVPADWVKVNVQRMKDCYEVYALVPGLLREEVRVQSDPAGRLVISGQPEQQDNPWGVTPFKKVVSLPTRIDPHQTSAVVTLHGQLFVRVPFEQSDI
ncbi:UNVERIFIED_CONTAM: AT-rich interactive domain-containing protein 3 [Sesamum angustifolium]|uniref:AT-rich interactive domain-containing protein 3 n=1 Tax=Sesamum angustifolium TaxID=2727405 RepID=A0AAW2KD66_9LAMI